ncbi:MAG: hypothetical protein ACYS8K_07980, partial [Planctomycetota bacterium]
DLRDTKLDFGWRVAAARALAAATQAARLERGLRGRIISDLSEVMNDEKQDDRINIGAAIALSQLRQKRAVRFLLDELNKSEEAIRAGGVSDDQLNGLTELRIRAQEALTASGQFVVPFLMEKLRAADPGDIILWAAAKTLGELRVAEAVPFLGRFLTERRDPQILITANGRLSGVEESADWRELSQEELSELQAQLEIFDYPDFLRTSCAIALGRMEQKEALNFLERARDVEVGLLSRVRAAMARRDAYKYAPVLEALIEEHDPVLFYVRRSLEGAAQAALGPAT